MVWFKCFDAQGVCAVIEHAASYDSTDDLENYDHACNGPIKNPMAHLDKVYWHSDFFPFELAMPEQTRVIAHPAVEYKQTTVGVSVQGGYFLGSGENWGGGVGWHVYGNVKSTTHVLVTHNLGYVPQYYISCNGSILQHGTIVQDDANGVRMVSGYADQSVIGLRDVGGSGAGALGGVNRTYTILVCLTPQKNADKRLFNLEDGVVELAYGKISGARRRIRRVLPYESGYDLDLGPTVSYGNGGIKQVTGGNVSQDDFYAGSFSGPAFVAMGT